MTIRSFGNRGTEDIAKQSNSKAARSVLPRPLHEHAHLRLLKVDAAFTLMDLSLYPSYRLEKLHGDRTGQYSIRINDQYRICFRWDRHDAHEVEIVDYHA